MDRRTFLQITGGVLTSLHLPVRGSAHCPPDPSLLEAGLCAMARADSWFPAHWGAALIAGAYLCSEAELPDPTRESIRGELEVLREQNARQCAPFPRAEPVARAVEQLEASLRPALADGVRHSGHPVIYTTLATRALEAHPELAIPAIVDPIVHWNESMARQSPRRPPEGSAGYRDRQHLAHVLFETMVRFEPLIGHPSVRRPNFTHWTTHTEALRRLAMAEKNELWKAGQAGHRAHLAEAVPKTPDRPPLDRSEVSLARFQTTEYWRDQQRTNHWHQPWSRHDKPNGDWIASGHLFKVLYAFHHVSRDVEDEQLTQRAARVVLERYFDPQVQGG